MMVEKIKEDLMILADKIISLRKKEGMTQEDLASQVGVSRQSVSKWESTMAMPDLDKIMKLSKIFEVSTDFLLNDDLGMEQIIVDQRVEEVGKTIDLDFLNEYLSAYEKIAKIITLATVLLVTGPVVFSLIAKFNQNLAIVALLGIVAIAVGIFINTGFIASKYEFIEKEPYNFSYGVEGVIKKTLDDYQPILKRNIMISIAIFILSPAMFVLMDNTSFDNDIVVYLFLILTALAAGLIAYTMIKYSSYRDILKYRDPKVQKKEGILGKASGILWVLTVCIYLAYSFMTNNWYNSWIIFIVATFIQVVIAMLFD